MINFQKEKGIMSLAIVFVIGLFGLGTALTVATVALVGLNKNIDNKSGNQSFYTAESAAREGAYKYINNYRNELTYDGEILTFLTPLNGIAISQISVVNPIWPDTNALVTATAANSNQRKVMYTLNIYPAGDAFSHALYSAGNIDVGSAALNVCGSVFADRLINCVQPINSDCVEPINTEISSPSLSNIDSDCYDDQALVSIEVIPPPEIENNDLLGKATEIGDSTEIEAYLGSDFNSPSAIIFTSGSSDILSLHNVNATFGALIVEGDLELQNVNLTGLIYVKGKITFKGGGPDKNIITGAVISLTDIETRGGGSGTITYNESVSNIWKFLLDDSETLQNSIPAITNWQEQ